MTNRAIFDAYVQKKKNGSTFPLTRIPRIEYAPYWDQTLSVWYQQGLDSSLPPHKIQKLMGLDPLWYTPIRPFGEGFPHPVYGKAAIHTPEDYEKILTYLYPQNPFWQTRDFILSHKSESDAGDFMFELNLDGFFWFPRELFGIEDHLVSFYDEPELYHRICEDLLQYNIRVVKEFLQYASPPFVILGEDMSYNHGSMISKAIWDTFLQPYFIRFTSAIHAMGYPVIFDSDGKIDDILDWLIPCGFDGILPLERMAGVDVNVLSKKYPNFLFIGGYDKTVMKHGEKAMRAEFERLLPALKNGNYIPCVDHQTPPDVSMENYTIYIQLLYEYTTL